MPRKYAVRFNVTNSMYWYSGGKIIFYQDYFELKFLWQLKYIVYYNKILEVSIKRKFLNKCIYINTTEHDVFLIACSKLNKIISEFKGLGFKVLT